VKIHDCYWCGKVIGISSNGEENWAICRNSKCAVGPTRATREDAIEAWNSLASRLKPEPKVVTLKRWVNVYPPPNPNLQCEYRTSHPGTEQSCLNNRENNCLDTVEVSITFTDSRGVV